MTGAGRGFDARGFDPEELGGAEGPELSDGEIGQAWAMGRELDGLKALDRAPDVHGPVSAFGGADPAFVSRVMAAIDREPLPRPVVAGRRAARELRPAGVLASLRDAWRVAFGPGRGMAARATALAYVLVALVALGSATGLAVVGTAALLAPRPTVAPDRSAPAVGPDSSPVTPPRSPVPAPSSPGPSVAPGPSTEPGETEHPDASEDSNKTPAPGATGSVPTSQPSPSDSPGETPDSTRTPRPSTSPTTSPTGTPKATSTSGGDH